MDSLIEAIKPLSPSTLAVHLAPVLPGQIEVVVAAVVVIVIRYSSG